MEQLLRDVTSSKGSLARSGMYRGTAETLKDELGALDDEAMLMVINVNEMKDYEQMKIARSMLGLTATETAKLLNISVSYVSRLESGSLSITDKMKYRLLNLCNFDIGG